MAESRPGAGIYKMNLRHLVLPASKEVLRRNHNDKSKGHRTQLKEFSMVKARII